NGVDLLFEAMENRGLDARALAAARIAVIGPGTAAALEAHGISADLVPERSVAEGLVEALGELRPAPDRVLLARAAEGRRLIPDSLQRMEIEFEDLALYETVAEAPGPEALDGLTDADWITFSSGSAVHSLIRALPGGPPERTGIASIGPVTSGVLRDAGLRVDAEAARPDLDGLIEVLLDPAEPEARR
ncbi:MAG: uroporphyrinogen-III synthase, partial [Acidobacteriota bacterium]